VSLKIDTIMVHTVKAETAKGCTEDYQSAITMNAAPNGAETT
jgi:hypothetical protein